jgi:MFS family permease
MQQHNRTPFSRVFWVANGIEVLERFVYYGIYFNFGIYLTHLGYSREDLGIIQTLVLLFSYTVPIFAGTFADRYGFKKLLIVSYAVYLPSVLLLILTKSFSGIALTMLTLGLGAGIFKPLVAGTVRATTDKSNATLGFGVFYAMVNVGGSLGPIVAGKLRATSWENAFYASAAAVVLMLLITIFFYKEPKRAIENTTLGQKFRDLGVALSDLRFSTFLVLLGVFFWIPFWAFFNLCALYVDSNLDTAELYLGLESVFGTSFANFFSHEEDGVRKLLGETISHTGYIIVVFQIFVSRISERFRPIPSFLTGLVISAIGFAVLGYARVGPAALVFLGIFLFAVGEMIASPRIQEYITWMAPKEKAGLYMGANFLATGIAAFSGVTYTSLYGHFADEGHPEYVWYILAGHLVLGILALSLFVRLAGGFQQQES